MGERWIIAGVGIVAVAFAFVMGFALGWTMHHPEPVRAVATSVPLPPPPASSIVSMSPTMITPPPPIPTASSAWVDDTVPFSWPTTKAPSHDVIALDPTHYLVDSGFVDDFAGDPSKLAASTRMVPDFVDGGAAGVRLFGVRATSLIGKLGIQNGDRIVSINGLPVADPTAMLEAYTRSRKAKNLAVAIVRRGVPMTLHYRVTG